MENYRQVPTAQLEELVFDDEQTAKVGAALRALADQITCTPRSLSHEIKTQNEVIELLSDSEGEDKIKLQAETENTKEIPHSTSELDAVGDRQRKSSHFDLYNPYDSDTMSAWTESSNSPLKFEYDSPEESGIQETSTDSNQLPPISTTAYVTLTDITGDAIQVKEVNAPQLPNGSEDQLVVAKQENEVKLPISLQDLNNEYRVEPNVTKEEIEVEEPLLQQYFKKEHKHTIHVDQSLNSGDVSNECSAIIGTDEVNTYCNAFNDSCEMSDLGEKQTQIDLVDSETDNEQDQWNNKQLMRTHNGKKMRSDSRTASIDTFTVYTCPLCGVLCDSFNDWKFHTDADHKFNTFGALNMQTIIDKDGHMCYQCRDCEQKFELHRGFQKLLPHRFKHLPNEDYLHCRLCQTAFRSKSAVRSHLAKVHHTIWREHLQQQKPPKLNAWKYIKICCPICNKSLSSRKQWQDHLEQVHDYSTNIMSQMTLLAENIYNCSVCNTKLRKRSIMDHMLTHEQYKSFTCTLCAKYEAVGVMLALTHVRRNHLMTETELLLKCNYCEATFEKSSHRKTHVRTSHKYMVQKCDICKKKFSSISMLLSHMNFANHHRLK